MFRDKKITIAIIAILMISVIGLGIAFAAFSQTLTINGTGTVEASKWQVVFEGMTNVNTIDAPTLVGTAAEVTHPTIKNDSTEISNYAITLKSPGDSVTYYFKIHNKGDYAANLEDIHIGKWYYSETYGAASTQGQPVQGRNLVTSETGLNTSMLRKIFCHFYYVDDNSLVGNNYGRDCLEPGESVDVALKIIYLSTDETDSSLLPSSDVVLDNLGISMTYNQNDNGSCVAEPIVNYTGNFVNYDQAYYTYEGKSFKGTRVDNLIITENIIGTALYATGAATDHGSGAKPRYTFPNYPAEDMAEAYCTGCRLMTYPEALLWQEYGKTYSSGKKKNADGKMIGYYNGSRADWFIIPNQINRYQNWYYTGCVEKDYGTISVTCLVLDEPSGVRPVTDIPSTATMTGSGTQLDPYVITVN